MTNNDLFGSLSYILDLIVRSSPIYILIIDSKLKIYENMMVSVTTEEAYQHLKQFCRSSDRIVKLTEDELHRSNNSVIFEFVIYLD